MRQLVAVQLAGSFLLAVVFACSGTKSAESRSTDEAAIRRTDDAWLQAIAARELDRTVSFYDEQASLFVPNAPIATGSEAIRKTWSQLFAISGFALTPRTTKIEVSRSGDLAYAVGTYELTANNQQGVPTIDRGKYVIVWKKQADGGWKAAADIFNSDLPAAPAPR